MQEKLDKKQLVTKQSTASGQQTDNDPVTIQMPSVSLPKGGGAITGMGEKFQVNPATGTGGLTIPIAMSQGRNGFTPQLALSYDSGAGNTIFGLGWNIGLPSISRKTSKGLPTYIDSEDVFLLAGAEDLVPVLFNDNTKSKDSADGNFVIHRFQPRIEGLFARIEKWTHKEDKSSFWKVTTKDNVTSIYGKGDNDNPSKIVHPDDDSKVFQWYLERTFDDKGNITVYEYKRENGRNTDGEEIEPDRIANNQVYLTKVLYGNTEPYKKGSISQKEPDFDDWKNENNWLFYLVLDYGVTEAKTIPTYNKALEGWAVRQDIFSSFRSGFDIRTYRLCTAIHCFHRMNEDGILVDTTIPVKSTCFLQEGDEAATQIQAIRHCFYYKGKYADLPPVEFCYTKAAPNYTVQKIKDKTTLENLPQGIDGQNYTWIDLYGEGISGVLNRTNTAWYYKPNNGNGTLGGKRLVKETPSLISAQLADVDGDGMTNLVVRENGLNGYYEINHKGKWENFQSFKAIANLNWGDPNLRMLDLTGDGFADILITDDNCFVWHPSKGKDGHDAAMRVGKALDEERGPRVAFSDAEQTIFLSDMSGDGLTDIVRIRNGSVCYWANMGYGRFSSKIVMKDAPRFDHPDYFDPGRIRLADIDGTGTTDILYLGRDKVAFWHNQSGNFFGKIQEIPAYPAISNIHSVNVFDFKGSGTACLVWSSPLPQDAGAPLRYIDLMGNKPYLLCEIKNNMGATTKMGYSSSTKYYLADKRDGRPWITKLPFPVQVLDRVEVFDEISNNHFVSTYAYHHGYFDGLEREFRGFGMVEQWDTEDYALLKENTLFDTIGKNWKGENPKGETSDSPPIYTKTWFHTGFFDRSDEISGQYKKEYYQGDDEHWLLEDTPLPTDLSGKEAREAARAMKGSILRQEVYSIDKSEKEVIPYVVTESNYLVKVLQNKGDNEHAIFLTTQKESLSYQYERDPADPRIAHTANLKVDNFGNATHAISIVYPRRAAADIPEQKKLYATLTENILLHKTDNDDWFRHSHPKESRTFEVRNLNLREGNKFKFSHLVELVFDKDNKDELKDLVKDYAAADSGDIDFRLLTHSRVLYFKDDVKNNKVEDFSTLPSLAIPYETYTLVFTKDILAQADGQTRLKFDNAFLETNKALLGYKTGKELFSNDGKETDWWHVPGRPVFDAAAVDRFYLPEITQDSFGNQHRTIFDSLNLFPSVTIDPLGNQSKAVYNYHFLQPQKLTDPNGSVTEVQFDIRGMVVATTISGTRGEGDLFTAINLDEISTENGIDYSADIIYNPNNYLEGNTTYFYYDVWAWKNKKQPAYAIGVSRETHVSDLNVQGTKTQIAISYSDGFGRERLTKVQAEDGEAPKWDSVVKTYVKDGNGDIISENTTNRWVANGAVIFNNKGKPIKQYEPFFDSHPFYIDDELLTQQGVCTTIHYDQMDRIIKTDMPDGTFTKVEFTPWMQKTYDQNDTLTIDNQWYKEKSTRNDLAKLKIKYNNYDEPEKTAICNAIINGDHIAATKALALNDTPAIQYLDTLGRPIVSIAHNKYKSFHRTNIIEEEQFISTKTELNIEGQPIKIIDARDNQVMHYLYAMNGMQLYQNSMDAGKRQVLINVMGNPVFTWDERGHEMRTEYDALQRPTHQWEDGYLRERIYYGEKVAGDYHKGQAYLHFDGAGMVKYDSYDFKGNNLKNTRRLYQVDYNNLKSTLVPDWKLLENELDTAVAITNTAALLEENFSAEIKLDALNRPIQKTAPDGSIQTIAYNKAGLLESVKTSIKAGTEDYVKNIDYNAKGQRLLIHYGNNVKTKYKYDEKTFRLSRLLSTKNGGTETVQDITYTYDPVGNITQIYDSAQKIVFYKGEEVKPKNEYTYDGLYRLREAIGRESIAINTSPATHEDIPQAANIQAGDNEVRNYRQYYTYDTVGNIKETKHIVKADGGRWTKKYTYDDNNNRLIKDEDKDKTGATTYGPHTYTYDAHGSMTQMGHLETMEWDYKDQLIFVKKSNTDHFLYNTYDTGRQRVRKIYKIDGDHIKERIYLGDYEIYRLRSRTGATINQQIDTLHIMDDQQRICLIETRVIKDGAILTEAQQQTAEHQKIRYQLNNHLGSSTMELSATAEVISYEEYHPYGSSSYRAQKSSLDGNPKRYRYSGKERDESTGLYYYGARYYASWLGRWCSADPAGLVDGGNLYQYVKNNSLIYVDKKGMKTSIPNEHQFKESIDGITYKHTIISIPPDNTLVRTSGGMKPIQPNIIEGHFLFDIELEVPVGFWLENSQPKSNIKEVSEMTKKNAQKNEKLFPKKNVKDKFDENKKSIDKNRNESRSRLIKNEEGSQSPLPSAIRLIDNLDKEAMKEISVIKKELNSLRERKKAIQQWEKEDAPYVYHATKKTAGGMEEWIKEEDGIDRVVRAFLAIPYAISVIPITTVWAHLADEVSSGGLPSPTKSRPKPVKNGEIELLEKKLKKLQRKSEE